MYKRIAHYTITDRIGHGAMGQVFRGMDENLQMEVAIKVLDARVAEDSENLARFEVEARAAANLKHPNIAHVFFIGRTDDGLPFYAMEFIKGIPLSTVISKRMRGSGRQVISIMQQTIRALRFAAEKNVLHRDVKPGNIMIDEEGGIKLVDFGLAKLPATDARQANVTQAGMAVGTPNYLSPEIAKGESADFRSDMYSAGVTFYELITGRLPFTGDTPMAVLMKHVQEPLPEMRSCNAQYPRSLTRVIERMLAKKPDKRFQNYADILNALDMVAENEHRFMESEWTFCEKCRSNTIFENRQCTICNVSLADQPQEEELVNVRLISFQNSEAQNLITDYMARTTNKPRGVVRQSLNHLPLLLATRIPLERGKRLQTKFYGMNATIELEKVGSRQIKGGPDRLSLKLSKAARESNLQSPKVSEASAAPASATDKAKNKTGKSLILLVLLAFVAVVAVVAAISLPDESNENNETKAATKLAPSPAIDTTLSEANWPILPIPNYEQSLKPQNDIASYSGLRGIFRLEMSGNNAEQSLETLGSTLSQSVSRLRGALGFYPPPLERPYRLEPNRPVPGIVETYGLTEYAPDGAIRVNASGLPGSASLLEPALLALIVRDTLRQWSGRALPMWLEVGFAFYCLERIYPERYQPSRFFGANENLLKDNKWIEGFMTRSEKAYAQAAAFMNYLIAQKQASAIISMTKQIRTGSSVDQAFENVFGTSRNALMQKWQASRSRETASDAPDRANESGASSP